MNQDTIQDNSNQPNNGKRIVIVTCIFFALVVAVTILLLPYIERLSDPAYQLQFKAWVDKMGVLGWLAVFGIQVLQIIIAFIPGEPIEILAGVLYGTFGGLFICLAGCLAASSAVFLLAKRFGKPFLHKVFGKERIQNWRWVHHNKKLELITFILFFIPGTPKDMLTYIVGASDLKLSRFLVISSLARIPSIITSTMVGATMRQGQWEISIAIFLVTGILGLVGLHYKDRAIEYCRRFSKRRKARKLQGKDFSEPLAAETQLLKK